MSGLRGWTALAAALVSCIFGVASLFESNRRLPHRPEWTGIVAPLASAPIPARSVTALAVGAGATPDQAVRLLCEAAWQRPDLLWALATELPPSLPPAAVVTVDNAAPPAGWRQVWNSGALRLWQRSQS